MSTVLQILAKSGVPLLLTGQHALFAHGCPREIVGDECECAIAAKDEVEITGEFAREHWSVVYRTPFFAKFRLLSTGTPVVKVLFLDDITFGQLCADSTERDCDSVTMRVPSLIHVIAMKLQGIQHEPHRETEDLPDVLELLLVNSGHWQPAELEAVCNRFGPPGVFARIQRRLAA